MEIGIFGNGTQKFRDLLCAVFPGATLLVQEAPEEVAFWLSDNSNRSIVLVPRGDHPLLHQFSEACAVSCGLSPKNSVTCSSLQEGRVTVSVGRELPVLSGGKVWEQELSVGMSGRFSLQEVLLLSGLCLCAGKTGGEMETLDF